MSNVRKGFVSRRGLYERVLSEGVLSEGVLSGGGFCPHTVVSVHSSAMLCSLSEPFMLKDITKLHL